MHSPSIYWPIKKDLHIDLRISMLPLAIKQIPLINTYDQSFPKISPLKRNCNVWFTSLSLWVNNSDNCRCDEDVVTHLKQMISWQSQSLGPAVTGYSSRISCSTTNPPVIDISWSRTKHAGQHSVLIEPSSLYSPSSFYNWHPSFT